MSSSWIPASPQHIVVMGVSGCGKTSVGSALAQRLGCEFLDGDTLHSAENIAKMTAGTPSPMRTVSGCVLWDVNSVTVTRQGTPLLWGAVRYDAPTVILSVSRRLAPCFSTCMVISRCSLNGYDSVPGISCPQRSLLHNSTYWSRWRVTSKEPCWMWV